MVLQLQGLLLFLVDFLQLPDGLIKAMGEPVVKLDVSFHGLDVDLRVQKELLVLFRDEN